MTRTQIIAQLEAEISRLERARDFLAAALKNSKIISAKSILSATRAAATTKVAPAKKPGRPKKVLSPVKAVAAVKTRPSAAKKNRRQLAPVVVKEQIVAKEVAPAAPVSAEPQIHRVPPKRRVERRQSQTEKAPSAALGGFVPTGPVVVSANEARKQQERSAPPAPTPIVSETRADSTSERSLGSLIQAFERRAGVNRLETP